MRFEKNKPGVMQFKYNFSDEEYRSIQVYEKGRPCKVPEYLKMLYENPIPISTAKNND